MKRVHLEIRVCNKHQSYGASPVV